ncbi:type II toxin-antitoxin system TacA family antitoxin [Rhizobium ruizarguesonis]|uniref:type II toxin-antitoxin system TacA family antitoxin n=1 Tax=Rhizobium ruizarguesonis TaxID=2081791 RepID=UPI001FE0CFF8
MTSKNATDTHTRAVNLRVREDVRVLIDRAAKAHGKTRSDFMIDASRRAAEDGEIVFVAVRIDPHQCLIEPAAK